MNPNLALSLRLRWEVFGGNPVVQSIVLFHLQVFWAGPLAGGIVAALLYDFVLFPRGLDVVSRLRILCHGAEVLLALPAEPEPQPEGGAPAAQWEK